MVKFKLFTHWNCWTSGWFVWELVEFGWNVVLFVGKMWNWAESWNGSMQNDIRKNPTFRSQFHEMCAKVGVDPLASNKGFWAELLGIGDFYYELGECIVCLSCAASLMSQFICVWGVMLNSLLVEEFQMHL